jgi:hypothetical protein
MTSTGLSVVSNVARDILQSAALFKTLPVVAWEYVSNGLQYVDQNVSPKVVVKIDNAKKKLTIVDNGAGMSLDWLQNFFTMHGHNQERLAGKGGRGMFGTGKSAAFGIANKLTVRTIHAGLLNSVSLSRADIDREAAKGNVISVPLTVLESKVPTMDPNGTTIVIEDIKSKLDVHAVIAFIERHIGRGFKNAQVIINDHEVEYDEPSFVEARDFEAEGEVAAALGCVTLKIRVSPAPLEEGRRGIDITSQGVLFETTLGSVEGREMSHYLFGELDVPSLINEGSGPSPAFNMTRDMHLNLENPMVHIIHAFISAKLDEVRRDLVDREKERRKGEDAKKLQSQADDIAKLLNDDFAEYSDKIARVRATVSGLSKDSAPADEPDLARAQDETMLFGGDESVEVIAAEGDIGGGPGDGEGGCGDNERAQQPKVTSAQDGDPLGRAAALKDSNRSSRGGFRVEYKPLGAEAYRAKYDRDSRTILINLDFPQITQAVGEGIESISFQRLSNEVAITEYAIAVSRELVYSSQYSDPSDYIFEIRDTIDRINRKRSEDLPA